MSLTRFLPSINNKMKQPWSKSESATYAAVDELPIDKGDRHLIFYFLRKFTRGIPSHD